MMSKPNSTSTSGIDNQGGYGGHIFIYHLFLTPCDSARYLGVMARPLRIDQEETFYHVISGGNERRIIFRDDADYEGFLSRLGRCSERFELDVFAYVLMRNHYHLLVRTHQANLSRGDRGSHLHLSIILLTSLSGDAILPPLWHGPYA